MGEMDYWRINNKILFSIALVIFSLFTLGAISGLIWVYPLNPLLLISIMLICFFVTVFRPFYGVLLFVFLIPTIFLYPWTKWANATVSDIVILSVFLGWIIRLLISQEFKIKKNKLDIAILIYIGLSLISTIPILLSFEFTQESVLPESFQDPSDTSFLVPSNFSEISKLDMRSTLLVFRAVLTLIEGAMVYFFAMNNINTKKQIGKIVLTAIIGLAVVSFIGIYQQIILSNSFNIFSKLFGICSTFCPCINACAEGKNPFAMYLTFLIPLSIIMVLYTRFSSKKIIFGLITIAGVINLIFSSSRTGWLANSIGLLVLLYFVWWRSKNVAKHKFLNIKNAVVLFFSILIIFAIAALGMNSISEKIESAAGNESTINSRSDIWLRIFPKIVQDAPMFGVGLGMYTHKYHEYKEVWVYASGMSTHLHNTYLHIWAERGPLALIALFYILFLILKSKKSLLYIEDSSLKIIGFALLAGIIGSLIHGIFDTTLINNRITMLFWFNIAFFMALIKIK